MEPHKVLHIDAEMAENFKVQGNACFVAGKRRYNDAIKFYTNGIAVNCEDDDLNSVLHSNRAAVNLALMNYRSCLYDCGKALQFNPKNLKAYYRSIKALYALDRVEEGIDCCLKASELDSAMFQADLANFQKKKIEFQKLAELKKQADERKQQELDALSSVIKSRPYKFTERRDEDDELITFQHPDAPLNKIQLRTDGELTFAVVFLYPEFNQSDIISEFAENDTFYSHFEVMFGEATPWDPEHNYNPHSLDWYFVSKTPKGDPKLVSVLTAVTASQAPAQDLAHRYVCTTLKDALSNPEFEIINNIVTFIILSRNTNFRNQYRKQFRST
jgi:tetratricopeptide (TPR) repeat protein